MTHQMPLLHSGTQRTTKIFHLMCHPSNAVLVWHQMQNSFGSLWLWLCLGRPLFKARNSLERFSFSEVENATTCCRAPRWFNPEFPRKMPNKYPPAKENTPRAKILDSQKMLPKYSENTEKVLSKYKKIRFGHFLGYLRRFFL